MDGVTAWVGTRAIGIPIDRLRRVVEAGDLQAFPLAAWPVEGIATIDALPVLQIALGGAVKTVQAPGGKLAVVETPRGRLALRVEAVTRGLPAEATQPSLLDTLSPWPHPPGLSLPSSLGKPWIDRRGRLAVLFATSGGVRFALPADQVQTVERIDGWLPQTPGGDAFLLRLGRRLIAARRLALAADTSPGAFALMPRGNEPVLTADDVEMVRPIPYRAIHAIRLNDGQMSWWIAETAAVPIRLRNFDPMAAAVQSAEAGEPSPTHGRRRARMPIVVLAQSGDVRFTLPISLVASVMLAPDSLAAPHGPPSVARLFGRSATTPARFLLKLAGPRSKILGVDQVALVRLPEPMAWAPLPACSPAIGKRFQAMARIGDGWVLLSRRHHPIPGDQIT